MRDRAVIPTRERVVQLARLIGVDVFTQRFGPPRAAEPDAIALGALVTEQLADVARRLVEEAVASDDVVDRASAEVYLEDRLGTLGDLIAPEQARSIRTVFAERTAAW